MGVETAGVHGDAVARAVVTARAEIGGIDHAGACRIELGDKWSGAAAISRLKRVHCWKIRRGGGAGDVGIASGVDGNRVSFVISIGAGGDRDASAKVCRVDQPGAGAVELRHERVHHVWRVHSTSAAKRSATTADAARRRTRSDVVLKCSGCRRENRWIRDCAASIHTPRSGHASHVGIA